MCHFWILCAVLTHLCAIFHFYVPFLLKVFPILLKRLFSDWLLLFLVTFLQISPASSTICAVFPFYVPFLDFMCRFDPLMCHFSFLCAVSLKSLSDPSKTPVF
jgi:hypothetical protein